MSEWVDIPLATQQAEDIASGASYVSDAELINLYLKENPPGSREPFHIASVPALSTANISLPGSGKIRGLFRGDSNMTMWLIRGTGIHYTNNARGAWTTLSDTMPGTGYCRFADVTTGIVATDGTNTRYITTVSATATSMEGFIDVAYQDGYTIYLKTDQSLYVSNLDAPATISALDFTTVDALGGATIGVVSLNRELFVFKTNSIENYYNAGGAGFPFQRGSPGLITRGVWQTSSGKHGLHTIAKGAGTVLWVGDDLRVYKMQGYQPVPISTQWVDRYLGDTVLSDYLFGGVFTVDGLDYYFISFQLGGTTRPSLVYDIKNGLWHKRYSTITEGMSLLFSATQSNSAEYTGFLSFVVSEDAAGVSAMYWLDKTLENDSGAAAQVNRVMTLPQYAPTGGTGRVFMPELYVDMAKAAAASTVTLTWSDDGGTTYSSGVTGTANVGRMRFQRLGSFYQRILRFTFSIASRLAIMGVRARVEVGE